MTRNELSESDPSARAPGAETERTPSPSAAALDAEQAELTRRALRALPEDYREILRLALVERRSLAEIAVLRGRSYEAAKKLYGWALALLARTLEELRRESRG